MKLNRAIARAVAMFHASEGTPRQSDYFERAEMLVSEHMPSGSGFDNGTKIVIEKSNLSRLVFTTSFHHMNEHGFYTGWTDHTVTLKANLDGHVIKVSGRDRNGIKEYIESTFWDALDDIEIDAF